jgi:hypothetical protein
MRNPMRSFFVLLWVGGFSMPFFLGACETWIVLPSEEAIRRENGGKEGMIIEADASEKTPETSQEARPEAAQEAQPERIAENTPEIPRSCEACAARLFVPTCPTLKIQPDERLLLLKGSLLVVQDPKAVSILDLSTCKRLPNAYSPRSVAFDIGHHILILEDSAMAFANQNPSKLTLLNQGVTVPLVLAAGWRFNNTRSALPPRGRGFLEFNNDAKKLLIVFYHSNAQTYQLSTFDAPSGSFGITPIARGKTHDLYRILPERSGQPAHWLTWNHQQGSLGRLAEDRFSGLRVGHLLGQEHAFSFVNETDAAGKPKLTLWRWPLATSQPEEILQEFPDAEPHKPILDGDRLFLAFSTSATLFSPSQPPITFDTSSQPFPSDTRFLHFQGQEIFAFLPQEGLFLFRLENATQRITKLPLLPPQALPNQPLSVQYHHDGFWSPTAPDLPKRWLITQAIPDSNKQRMWYAEEPNPRISEPFEGRFVAPAIMGRITEGWRFYADTLSYYSDDGRAIEHTSLRLSDGKRFSHIQQPFLQRIGEPSTSERIEVVEYREEEAPQRFHIIDHQCHLTSSLTPAENNTQILASDSFLVTQSNLSASSVQFFAICQP